MAGSVMKGWNGPGAMSVGGGFLLHLTLGTLYCFGNLNTYMTSYLRVHVPSQAGIHYSDAIWIPTLATLGQGLFMTLSGHLEDRVGIRITILMGSALMSSGVFLTYFTIQHSLWLTTFTYGFMFGLGTALAYAPPMGVAMRWFPKIKGLVNGIIVGGFGAGAFIFNQVQTAYLNPDNISPGEDGYFTNPAVLERVPSVFLLLGSIYSIMQLIAIILIIPPSDEDVSATVPIVSSAVDDEDVLYQSDSFSERSPDSTSPSNLQELQLSEAAAENVKPGQVVRSSEFWILWFTFVFNTQAVGYINTMYKAGLSAGFFFWYSNFFLPFLPFFVPFLPFFAIFAIFCAIFANFLPFLPFFVPFLPFCAIFAIFSAIFANFCHFLPFLPFLPFFFAIFCHF